MEEVTKMVMGAAAGGNAELKIVSIVGMAGSGKTALATAVYHQLRQQSCFQLHAFVSLGKKEVMAAQVLNSILSELDDGDQGGRFEHISTVVPRLREILQNKRYLIVLDDLWRLEGWRIIRYCFPENSLCSRVITTTRNFELAMKCSSDSSGYIYNIGLLSEVDSKNLLLGITGFNTGHGCPQHKGNVFEQLTRRCGGLPLALIMAAGDFMENRLSKDELIGPTWLSSSSPHAQNMKHTLNLSYNYLQPHLKTCLLDLSIFPWNSEVNINRLTRRWGAEGFIVKEHDASVEQIARMYLNELVNRNMVLPLFWNEDGIQCCRLHPMIHDFLVCKSMEENFATHMDDQQKEAPRNYCTIRRLCLQSCRMHDDDQRQHGGMDLSRVRSVTIFGQANSTPQLTNLRVVRVLDLEGCIGPVCLDDLVKLHCLKYLSLKGTDVSELPETIGELRWLEALDVRSTKVKEFPWNIVGLRNTLKTLLFSCEGMIDSIEITTRIAKHCRKLENLATIDLREHHESFVKDLGDLNNLRMLEITWSFHQCTEGAYRKSLLSSIAKWRQLRSLTIRCGIVGCCMEFLDSLSHPPELLEKFKVTAGGFVSIPKWIQRLNYLSFLQISISKIETDDLKILRDIPQLQILILGLDFVPREPIVIESQGFDQLLRFSVDCPVLWLTFQVGAMPNLTHLQLEFCSGSTNPLSVPSGIGGLQKVTEVVLLYNQKWSADSSSVKMTVDAVKGQVVKHRNLIDLIINDTNVVYVREVDEKMESRNEIQSSDVGEETARTTEETRGEIEFVAEGDNTGSTY